MMFHHGVLITLLVFLSANAAHAATLIKAGEHGTYSRIVIPGAPIGWSMTTNGRFIEISLPSTHGFDLSEVATKRKAHRILSAKMSSTVHGHSLIMALTCDCTVQAVLSSQNSIIIDILDPVVDINDSAAPETEAATVGGGGQSARTPDDLRTARDRMIALLAAANNSGVIQLRKDAIENNPHPLASDTEPTAPATTHIRLDSANDVTPIPLTPRPDLFRTECIDPARFSESLDRVEEINYPKIAALRAQIEEETDGNSRAATIELAYLYLRVGFFEEASAAAQSGAQSGDAEMALITSLAELGGARDANAAIILKQFADCSLAYETLLTAARINHPGKKAFMPLSGAHISTLKSMMRPLRGPIAEKLALNALDNGNTDLAKQFFEIATEASDGGQSPALTLLAAKLQNEPSSEQSYVSLEPIAQTPGPLQMRALGEIADQYQRDSTLAYDGFLEDLAALGGKFSDSQADIQARITGAKVLAANGRISEALDILSTLANSPPAARETARLQARSSLMTLLANEDSRINIAAASLYLQHSAFLEDASNNHELSYIAAKIFGDIGAVDLALKAVNRADGVLQIEKSAVAAAASLNAGDSHAALSYANDYLDDPSIVNIAIRANEKIGNDIGVAEIVNSAIRRNAMTGDIARAAWRSGKWKLVTSAYQSLPVNNPSVRSAKRHTLAALAAGASRIPEPAAANIAGSNERAALTHMFSRAPHFNLQNLSAASAFANGVFKETAFISEELQHE